MQHLADSILGDKDTPLPNSADVLDRVVDLEKETCGLPILIPYRPQLQDAPGVMDIIRFFGDRPFFACLDCVDRQDLYYAAVSLLLGSRDA